MALPNVLANSSASIVTPVALTATATSILSAANGQTSFSAPTIAAGSLKEAGDSVAFEYYGEWATSTALTVSLNFGAENVFSLAAYTPATASAYVIQGRITRVDAVTVRAWSCLMASLTVVRAQYQAINIGAPVTLDTHNIILSFALSVTGGTAGAMSMHGSQVTLWPIHP